MTPTEVPPVNILLLDDEPFIRNTIKLIINRAFDNIEIREGIDGTDGLRVLDEGFRADLVLCDLRMAPMDGLGFLRMTRASGDAARRAMPIIMLTGTIDDRTVHLAGTLGACGYLPKPVSLGRLTDTISAALRNAGQGAKVPHRRTSYA